MTEELEDEVPEEQKQAELTPEQIAMASAHVTIQYTSGNLRYSHTDIESIADSGADAVMTGLHSVICKQLLDEYHRDGYLSKNSHRRLTQVIHMYRMDIMHQLKRDVEAAMEQVDILDRYSDKISKEYRANRTRGNVEVVTEFPPSIEKRRSLLRKES